jgi:hypothetical protein
MDRIVRMGIMVSVRKNAEFMMVHHLGCKADRMKILTITAPGLAVMVGKAAHKQEAAIVDLVVEAIRKNLYIKHQ